MRYVRYLVTMYPSQVHSLPIPSHWENGMIVGIKHIGFSDFVKVANKYINMYSI